MRVTLTAGAAGTLELIDAAGRRIAARNLAGLGPGSHVLDLATGTHVPIGLYMVRLRAGGAERVARVTVLE
jgi:hypothetical protein